MYSPDSRLLGLVKIDPRVSVTCRRSKNDPTAVSCRVLVDGHVEAISDGFLSLDGTEREMEAGLARWWTRELARRATGTESTEQAAP